MECMAFKPGFRKYYNLDSADQRQSPLLLLRRKAVAHTEKDFKNDPLDWCLFQIVGTGTPDFTTPFDHAMLLSFLQNYLSQCPLQEKARLDDVLYHKLSEALLSRRC